MISTANLKDDDDLLALLLGGGDENSNFQESASIVTQTPSPTINARDLGLTSNRIRFYKDFDFLQAC